MKAVILCAGEGTRLRPLTDTIPKTLVSVAGIPILARIFSALPDLVSEVIIVIQEKQTQAIRHFLTTVQSSVPISIAYQNMNTKGTFYALFSAKPYVENEDSFLVLNGDDVFDKKELEALVSLPAPAYALSQKILTDTRYSTCDVDVLQKRITSFRLMREEEKDTPVYCFTGACLLTKDFFTVTPEVISSGEAGIPHTLFASGFSVSYTLSIKWLQINTHEDLRIANEASYFLEQ